MKERGEGAPLSRLFKKRLSALVCFAGVLSCVVVYRLFSLHVLQHEHLTSLADRQYYRTVTTQPYRGTLYDRNHKILAINLETESVYAVPQMIDDAEAVIKSLAPVLGLSASEQRSLTAQLAKKRYKFRWVKRKVSPEVAEQVKGMKLPGIHFMKETKRYYPHRELAASVLGFVGIDNQGLYGLETALEGELRGEKKKVRILTDARGHSVELRKSDLNERAYKGNEVILTIEHSIQYRAEEALKRMVDSTGAKNGKAIVMDVHSGDILAMAEYPDFNPNRIQSKDRPYWKNGVVSDAFEPGSVMKPFIVAAAVNEGLVNADTVIYCENGSYRIADDRTIGEANHHHFGNLSVRDILTKSSNIGTIKLAELLGKKKEFHYIRAFGFNSVFGLETGRENKGLLAPLRKWEESTLASVAFGQEISVNMLQLATAYSAIANGGYLIRPHIVRSIRKSDGEVVYTKREVIRRVLTEKTSKVMRKILQNVVEKGTGKRAGIEGYAVAGKTGSAQKFNRVQKAYSKENNKMVASFGGFIPADHPQVVIITAIDEAQKGFWGGVVAAPVFRDIGRQAINRLGIASGNGRNILEL